MHRHADSNDSAQNVLRALTRAFNAGDFSVQPAENGRYSISMKIPASMASTTRLGANERKAAQAITKLANTTSEVAGSVEVAFSAAEASGQARNVSRRTHGNALQEAVFSFDTSEAAQQFGAWMQSEMNKDHTAFTAAVRKEAELDTPSHQTAYGR